MFLCRDATELLTDAREGALSGWRAVQYRFHLTVCPACRRYRQQVDETIALAREIPPDDVPAPTMEAAVAALRTRRHEK